MNGGSVLMNCGSGRRDRAARPACGKMFVAEHATTPLEAVIKLTDLIRVQCDQQTQAESLPSADSRRFGGCGGADTCCQRRRPSLVTNSGADRPMGLVIVLAAACYVQP